LKRLTASSLLLEENEQGGGGRVEKGRREGEQKQDHQFSKVLKL